MATGIAEEYISKATTLINLINTVMCDPNNKFTKEQILKIMPKTTDLLGLLGQISVSHGKLEGELIGYKDLHSSQKLIAPQSPQDHKTNTTLCEAADEIEERKKRSKNLIIFNIPESTASSQVDKLTDDASRISAVLSSLNPSINQADITTYRLGVKNTDKPRPLKVILDNASQTIDILRKKSNITGYPGIKIYSDQTPVQRKYLSELRISLEHRTQEGEQGLTIKYINNKPVIVKTHPKN